MADPLTNCSSLAENGTLPNLRLVDIGLGFPVLEEDSVEFHLLYSGELHVNYTPEEKHRIRKVFHCQLRRLWETNPNLQRMAEQEGRIFYAREIQGKEHPAELTKREAIDKGISELGKIYNTGPIDFLPLVTEKLCVRCRLDILFLRREESNFIVSGGDIDGRLKTLFDALQRPVNLNEIPKSITKPDYDEYPMFVLLENDKLISDVNIETGQLLRLPEYKPSNAIPIEISKAEVYLQIGVKLASRTPTLYDWVF